MSYFSTKTCGYSLQAPWCTWIGASNEYLRFREIRKYLSGYPYLELWIFTVWAQNISIAKLQLRGGIHKYFLLFLHENNCGYSLEAPW